jgi:DNA processing protein
LLEPNRAESLVEKLHPQFDTAQLRALLARGFALSLSVEKWTTHGIWIVARDDERYPARLKARLKHLAPPLLYGCGESAVLNSGGVAIVGSREVDEAAIGFTQEVAKACAGAQMTVVSGGARGVDQVAMLAATEAGGKVSGVVADSLARNSTAANAREAIQEGRMTLISPFDPLAGFHVGNAMARNKLIYALADYGVVISSGYNEGGTWSGAIEQLQKLKFVPLFVRDGAQVPEGNKRLLSAGGLPFPAFPLPCPLNEELSKLMNEANASNPRKSMVQSSLF